jgi:hypothetical protein
MLAALDAGIRSLQTEPSVPAEDVRKKISAWTTGQLSRQERCEKGLTEEWEVSFPALAAFIRFS